jgi:hypothetical protein
VRRIRKLRKLACLGTVIWIGIVGGVRAADPPAAAGSDAEPSAEKAPLIALDKLLTIPDSMRIEVDRRGGATRSEWRTRFVDAEANIVDAKQDLEASLDKLTDLAGEGGNWKVAAPGAQASIDDTTPMSYGLKQQIRRDREAVERTDRELVDLKVQANLAGVPNEWWMER